MIELPGSRTVTLRTMRPSDAPGLRDLFASMGEDDLVRRFFSGRPPPDQFVERMARVADRGGIGLVAVLDGPGVDGTVVAEAACELLPDGNGELGITVSPQLRGWLGPFILDALVSAAARQGIPAVEADVLMANRPMLALLRRRGLAGMAHSERPATVRVVISTGGRVPPWPWGRRAGRRRLLVEHPAAEWHADDAARAAGYDVLVCPGPGGRWSGCPALRGEPCPLVAGADVVVDALPGRTGEIVLDAHHRLQPTVPVCVELPVGTEPGQPGTTALPRGKGDVAVVGVVQRVAHGGTGEGAADR